MEPNLTKPAPGNRVQIDFANTKNAFSIKSDKELKKMAWLFKMMNKAWLVNIGSKLGLWAFNMRLPFVKSIIKNTIFEQFVGGESLEDCAQQIQKLYQHQSLTILDFGAEGKSTKEELDYVMNETRLALRFATENAAVPVISTKVTGLVDNKILEKLQRKEALTTEEEAQYSELRNRLDLIGAEAAKQGVGVFVDAEESWMQDPIDDLVMELMAKYNRGRVLIYNTYQIYRHDKLAQLKKDHEKAVAGGYLLGAKLVRGAYMDKERERAKELGYPSPIQPDKAATDRDFDLAVAYCVEHYETIASCCASHNVESNRKQAQLIHELGIPKDHPHLNFCQLYGMSDYITFNLGQAGYNAAKYVPYGPIRDVIPYLIRRAQENSSVTGEMSRELKLIKSEINRRG